MNHIYRLIWSQLEQAWVAVAETAKARGKCGSVVVMALALNSAAGLAQSVPAANALPTGGKVSAGQASISQSANVLTVQQTSQRAALDWQSFNIGAAATVNFNQPGINSVALNRIIGNDASQIYGKLNANGQVFFSNPNGMLFARGAQVNVGGILASTLRLGNADFMAGNYRFSNPGSGNISNQGLINALGGVTLMGNNVDNSGQINASSVSLVSGNMLAVDLSGDGLIRARVSDATGSLGQVVNNSGVIKASGLAEQGGDILLQGGRALNAGSLDASSATGIGGTVKMLGTQVGVTGNGSINASGASGGGTILLGGDFQGKNPEVPNANVTYFGPDTRLKADAIDSGNGGKVIVWADDTTRAFGRISAMGGANGGDGGFVETSGHHLDVSGIQVNSESPNGQAGTWLLDPWNVTISATANTAGAYVSDIWTPNASGSVITPTTITGPLVGGTSVTITTTGSGTEAGDITVSSPISASIEVGSPTLTLNAAGTISINSDITASLSPLNLVLSRTANAFISNGVTVNLNGGVLDTRDGGNQSQSTVPGSGALTLNSGTLSHATLKATQVWSYGGTFANVTLQATSLSSNSGATLSNVTIGSNLTEIGTGSTVLGNLTLADGVTLNKGSSNLTFQTGQQHIAVQGGTGTATVSSTGGTILAGSAALGQSLQIDSGITLQGHGTLTEGNFVSTVINAGTIFANTSGQTFTISPTTFTNSGTLNVASGATLSRPAGFSNTGTLMGSGTVTVGTGVHGLINQGIINPGGTGVAGTLSITGDLTLDTGSNLNIELGGTGAGKSDTITVNGSITNTAGTLTGSLLSGYTPVNADAFPFLTQASTAPAMAVFSTVNNPANFNVGYALGTAGEAARLIYAGGSTITFTNAAFDLNWATPGNWSGSALPGGLDSVLISSSPGVTVTHSTGTDSIAALTINASNSLNVSGGSLTVNGTTTLQGGLGISANGALSLVGGVNGSCNSGNYSCNSTTQGQLTMSGGTLNLGNMLGVANFSLTGGTINNSGRIFASGNLTLGAAGTIAGTGSADFSSSAPLVVDSAINLTSSISLSAPSLTLNRSLQAQSISLSADNPITLATGTTVIASNGDLTYPWGNLNFSNYTSTNPMVVGTGGWIDVTNLSKLGGTGKYQASDMSFSNYNNSLTLNTAPVGLQSVMLRAPTLIINDNLLANYIDLSADNPITLATGKTVIASNGNATNLYGSMSFSNYTSSNPMVVGAGGLVDGASVSALGGTGRYQASDMSFSNYNNSLTLNTAPVGLQRVDLRAPTLVINDNLLANNIGLSADNPIALAAGKTVIASNGNPLNPYGYLDFSSYYSISPMIVGAGGLVDGANLSTLGGTGTYQASGMSFSNYNGTLTVNTAPVGLQQLNLSANTLVINDNLQAGQIDLFASTSPLQLTTNVTAGSMFVNAVSGLTNSGNLSGSGFIQVGTGSAGFANTGTLNPGGIGAAGSLTVTGNLTLATGSNLAIELGGTGIGQSDLISVSGSITNTAGTLTPSLLAGYTPVNADAIPFLTQASTAPAIAAFTTGVPLTGFSPGYNLATGEAARLIFTSNPSTATFTNASGGLDWSLPGNWSTGAKPGAADTALLSTGLAVTHSTGTDSIAALTINSGNSLDVSGGSLAVSGNTTLGGMVPASTLTVSGTGNVSLAGGVSGAAIGSVIHVNGGTLDIGSAASLNELHMTGGSLIGSGAVNVNGLFSQTGGSINKTGLLTIEHWGSALNLGNITAGALQISTDNDVNITDSVVSATGGVTVSGVNLNVSSSTAPALLRGATMDVAMTGNITLTGGAAGSNNHADVFSTNGYQTVSAYGITLTGGSGGGWPVGTQGCCGNYAGLFSNGGNQTITVGAGGFTLLAGGDVNDTTATDNFAFVLQNGTTGTSQTITVKDGGSIVVTGGNSAASSTAGGIGSMAAIQAQGDSQLIEFLPVTAPMALGSLTLTGGTTGSGNLANISAINGSQTITGAPNIKLTGGASGGVDGNGNSASIQAKTAQTITSGNLTLNDGATGVGNSASINAASQTITVNGNLALNGGGSASGSLSKGGAGIGGFTSTGFGATDLTLSVTGNMTLTSGSVSGAGLVGFNGQTTNITANVGGNITLDPGVGTGLGTLIGAMPGSSAPGLISLTAGGAIALKGQALVQSLGNVSVKATNGILIHDSSVTSGGLLTAQAANLTLSADTAAAVLRGASMQADLTGALALTGGAVGTGKYASMTATSADQSITASGITLTGGASGGGLGVGNFAQIFSPGNQHITVGAGGLHLVAGGGGASDTDNFAMLLQGGTTAPVVGSSQTITVNNGGAILMTGGSSGLTSVGTGHGSRALIESDGASQTIHFTAGGAMNLTGGTAGSRAYASIYTLTGSQTISGAPDITLVGGSGGGVAGEGNKALIWSDLGTQTIAANSISLTGGSAGINNWAQIGTVGSQSISVGSAGLSLTGGSGGATDLKNFASLYQSGLTGTSQTITISGGGHITLQGGSSQGTNVGANNGSFAFIRGDGDSQTVNFSTGGAIDITGGALGSNNDAGIYARNGWQTVTGATRINLTGGADGGTLSEGNAAGISSNGTQTIDATTMTLHGGAGGTGNEAYVFAAVGNQVIMAGSGGLALAGGAGVVSNHAVIRQKDATATQTITITGGGSIDITGGSSSDTTAATAGSNGDIQGNGTLQTIDFTAGGSINMLGGTVGGGNQAFIRSTVGNQTITGAPSISLTGGANGGIDGEGNASGISANLGHQTIASGNMTITGGAGGMTNSAYMHGLTQIINVQGNLALTGGGSSNGTVTGGGAGMGGNGGTNASGTNLTLAVSGNLTLTGGSVSGASIGSGYVGGQSTDLAITVGGDLTMNPGTVAGVGTRIGTPISASAAGSISLSAAGDVSLTGDSTVHTLGNVALTAGRDILAKHDLVQAGGTVTAFAGRDIRLSSGATPTHTTAIKAVGDISLQADTGALYVDSTAAQAAGVTSSAGSINVVTATGFKNGSTSGYANTAALSAPLGRWLIWAPDPAQNTTSTANGGSTLLPDFIQYNAAWGVTSPVVAGNGLMFAVAPVATASLSESVTGTATKVYDGGTAVTGMALSAPGAYAGDVLTLTGTLAYASKNAGTQAINATGISLLSAANGTIPVYGYQLQDVSASFTNATITARPMSNWTASVSGNWSNPANWDVMPDGSNVLGVTIPSGATVTYDSAVGITHLQSLSSNGTLNLAGGTLDIANQLSTQNYSQSAGVVNGAGSFTVSNSFSQSGGSVTMGGPVSITQISGDLSVGNISAAAITLNASNGAISQSAALTSSGLLSTQSSLGTTLNHVGNQLSAFKASNSASGIISLTNTGVFDIQGISTTAGSITVDNTGATRTSALVKAGGGDLNISAHSPLSIGAAGLQASGNISLSAANSDGSLQLDGPVSASSGGVTLSAGASYTQNSAVSAATTVTATAGPSASVTFGSAATTVAPVVTYSVTGSTTPVAPPPTTLASPPPTIDACTANPATSGCSTILPTLATCTTAPTTAGCSVVLPTLATCTAAPNTAGCAAVLPLISTCIAAPSTAGCSVVLPTLATCTAAQTTPGCADVLAAAKAAADADAAAKAAANAAAKIAADAEKASADATASTPSADTGDTPASNTPAPRSQQSVTTAASTADDSNAPAAQPEVKKVVMQTVIVANAVVQKPSEEIVRPAQAVGQRLICR